MTIFHYVNNVFVPENEAFVSTLDLSVLRGYGVFDYAQSYKGQPFHLFEHLERLKSAVEQLELPLRLSVDEIIDLTYDLLSRNPIIDAGIRFLVTGGLCSEDFLLPDSDASLIILFHPHKPLPENYYSEGMRAVTIDMLRMMPAIKTTNYMPAIFGMKRAKEIGFHDALYLNEKQELLEGTTSNLFFFKNGRIITSESKDIVKGITRSILLRLAKDHFPIEYRCLPLDEVKDCQEAFLCSSVKDVISLVQIDDIKIGSGIPGPLSAKLRKLFRSYLQDYLSIGLGLQRSVITNS